MALKETSLDKVVFQKLASYVVKTDTNVFYIDDLNMVFDVWDYSMETEVGKKESQKDT